MQVKLSNGYGEDTPAVIIFDTTYKSTVEIERIGKIVDINNKIDILDKERSELVALAYSEALAFFPPGVIQGTCQCGGFEVYAHRWGEVVIKPLQTA